MDYIAKSFSALLVVLSLLFPLLTATGVKAEANLHGFNSPSFSTLWERNDKLVHDSGATIAGRGYTWGFNAPGNAGYISTELYESKPRLVQYFDKARMELVNPTSPDAIPVITGLLVKELVTGNRQDGDSTFTTLAPSTVQIADDPNDKGGNAIAPTYASFKNKVALTFPKFGGCTGKQYVKLAIQATGVASTIKRWSKMPIGTQVIKVKSSVRVGLITQVAVGETTAILKIL